MQTEKEFWSGIQKYRLCETCLYFDKKRRGKMGFCTYPFKLIINDLTKKCESRKDLYSNHLNLVELDSYYESGQNYD